MPGGKRPPLRLYSEHYAAHLAAGWEDLLKFFEEDGISRRSLGLLTRAWDYVLVTYVKARYRARASRSLVVHALLAVQKRKRWTRAALPRAWAWTWAWRERAPPKASTPCPRPILEAILGVLFGLATMSPTEALRRKFWTALGALWMGFEGMLRPCEFATARTDTMVFGEELGDLESPYLVVVVETPKNRRAFGVHQYVLVDSPPLVCFMKWIYDATTAGLPLFKGGRQALATIFEDALAMLLIPKGTFTLRSLRPGKASEDFRLTRNVQALQFTGRWRRLQTMHSYLQEAAAALVSGKLSMESRSCVEAARQTFLTLKSECDVGVPGVCRRAFAGR